ncbi:MAG: hypothetical protein JSS63_14800 [Bacteroidetes bacterium]|nr:hypothetical protein [Bacteroidota bacterium]
MNTGTSEKAITAFYFINYNRSDLVSVLKNFSDSSDVICLDLEDSIQDLRHPLNNSSLKNSARNFIRKIFSGLRPLNVNFGIRINSYHSKEFILDIKLLSESFLKEKIKSILIPKVESVEEVELIINSLEKTGVNAAEIIPVIETKKGFKNLESIVNLNNLRLRRIAFGHCDFNIDNNFFPFFHQNSRQYWEWVKEFTSIIESAGMQFINSPFLKLQDDYSFQSMLSKLFTHCSSDFGQITLTNRQTQLCKKFQPDYKQLNGYRKQLNENECEIYAKELVNDFESYNEGKGFTISNKRTLISPQEYTSARKFIMNKALKLTIAGGCFTAQSNIPKEKLYHQIAKKEFERKYKKKVLINIIRYERFTNCFEKIRTHVANSEVDLLLFHIRVEQVLRIAKLIYKYSDDGKIKRALTIPFLNIIPSEKKEILQAILPLPNPNIQKPEGINKAKIKLNYLLGKISGNLSYAIKVYDRLVSDIMELCRQKNIKLIIAGPASRPYLDVENNITEKLFLHFKKKAMNEKIPFINLLGCENEYGESLFFESGIHVSEAGHIRAAKLLLNELNKIYST